MFFDDRICIECCKQYKPKVIWQKQCCTRCQEKQSLKRLKKRREDPEEAHRVNERNRYNYRKRKGLPLNVPYLKRDKGAGGLNSQGYWRLYKPGHPNAGKRGHILQHTLVMSEYLKRPLAKGETVHHKNGIRTDNRIENLEVWSSSHPPGQRVEDKIKWCLEFLKFYGY